MHYSPIFPGKHDRLIQFSNRISISAPSIDVINGWNNVQSVSESLKRPFADAPLVPIMDELPRPHRTLLFLQFSLLTLNLIVESFVHWDLLDRFPSIFGPALRSCAFLVLLADLEATKTDHIEQLLFGTSARL